MDWDHDGDDDYVDGFVDGVYWFGPWQLALLVVVVSLLHWAYVSWY